MVGGYRRDDFLPAVAVDVRKHRSAFKSDNGFVRHQLDGKTRRRAAVPPIDIQRRGLERSKVEVDFRDHDFLSAVPVKVSQRDPAAVIAASVNGFWQQLG